ncbi:MAG: 30S ribosomal protein S19e [Candidatus Nanoarchaeia archaeon]|nr:30S ribosomal protein S19e [Candidatus Nanoarchaeia archaeon]MDD5239592.1 30S ribosomal protein S19e [Candidatus Nanoarchaeia archaeon]
MVNIFDVEAGKLIPKLKDELKKVEQIKPPAWSKFVKTAVVKSRPPQEDDFWYTRAAAMLRQMYKTDRPLGVQRLRTKYGGKEQNRSKPAHYKKGSGSIIRKLMQQLESAGFVKKTTVNKHAGRVLTPKGKSFIDKVARTVLKG